MRLTIPLIAIAGVLGINAQMLTISEPTAAHWWIAQSVNTLAWGGSSGAPQQFSVFLNNPDASILTSKLALISVQPLYEYSKTVNPGNIKPGTGYTVELTDTLNSSNIYVTSETFEIKAVGSPYPPQVTMDPSASASTGSSSAIASTTSHGGAMSTGGMSVGAGVVVGMVGLLMV